MPRPSTRYGRGGEKLEHYERCPSVRAVLIVSHRRRQVTAVVRSESGWVQAEHFMGDAAALRTPELALSVSELSEGIRLDGAE